MVAMKPIRDAVAFVVRDPARAGALLLVRRPPDDPDLPDLWGLPAGSRQSIETWHRAVERAGLDKLGVELRVGALLNEGTTERAEYTLHMRLYEAEVVRGELAVPQPFGHVTQYRALEWGPPERLEPAAAKGSLCCRLLLDALSP